MSLSTDYYRWYDHHNSNTDYLQVARKYFYDNSEILGLSKAKSMISIGAGEGLVDTYILKNCTPKLQHYIGVEPHKPSFDSLREATSTFTNIEVTLVNEGLPGWKGPTEPVDIVVVSHVLYHIPERQSTLRQCYNWLKPGGSIIVLQSYDDNIFVQMGKQLDSWSDHFQVYDCERIKQDLVKMGLPYSEGSRLVTHFTSDIQDEDILKLYFLSAIKGLSVEQAVILVQTFREKMKNTCNEFLHSHGCIKITKVIA